MSGRLTLFLHNYYRLEAAVLWLMTVLAFIITGAVSAVFLFSPMRDSQNK